MAYENILPQAYAQLEALAVNTNHTPYFIWQPNKMDIAKRTMNNKDRDGAWFYIKLNSDTGGNIIDGTFGGTVGNGIYTNSATITVKALVKRSAIDTRAQDEDYQTQIVEGKIQKDIITAFAKVYDELCQANVRQIDYNGATEPQDDQVPHGERAVRVDFSFTVVYEQSRSIK